MKRLIVFLYGLCLFAFPAFGAEWANLATSTGNFLYEFNRYDASTIVGSYPEASIPSPATTGFITFITDRGVVGIDSTASRPWFGPVLKMTPPASPPFHTNLNFGASTTITWASDVVTMTDYTTAGTDKLRMVLATAPATPYTITFHYLPVACSHGTIDCGITRRNSGNSRHVAFWQRCIAGQNTTSLYCAKWTTTTAYSAAYSNVNTNMMGPRWLRVSDNGTNSTYSWSINGVDFQDFTSTSSTDWTTFDQVGFYINLYTNHSATNTVLMLNWKVE